MKGGPSMNSEDIPRMEDEHDQAEISTVSSNESSSIESNDTPTHQTALDNNSAGSMGIPQDPSDNPEVSPDKEEDSLEKEEVGKEEEEEEDTLASQENTEPSIQSNITLHSTEQQEKAPILPSSLLIPSGVRRVGLSRRNRIPPLLKPS